LFFLILLHFFSAAALLQKKGGISSRAMKEGNLKGVMREVMCGDALW